MSFIPLLSVIQLLDRCSEEQRRLLIRLRCNSEVMLRAVASTRSDDIRLWQWFFKLSRKEALRCIPYLRVISRIYIDQEGNIPPGLITDSASFHLTVARLRINIFPAAIHPDGESISAIKTMEELLERLLPTEIGDIAYGIREGRITCYKTDGQGFIMIREKRVLIASCGPRFVSMDSNQECRLRAWCGANGIRR